VEHAEAFNLYEPPFTDMQFNVDIGHGVPSTGFKISTNWCSTEDHYIYLDTVSLDAAEDILLNVYFNGSDPTHIFLEPSKISGVDLTFFVVLRILVKMPLFPENLHGALNAGIIVVNP
jgi:hypothetical protein